MAINVENGGLVSGASYIICKFEVVPCPADHARYNKLGTKICADGGVPLVDNVMPNSGEPSNKIIAISEYYVEAEHPGG